MAISCCGRSGDSGGGRGGNQGWARAQLGQGSRMTFNQPARGPRAAVSADKRRLVMSE
jgi:hypothetical protein